MARGVFAAGDPRCSRRQTALARLPPAVPPCTLGGASRTEQTIAPEESGAPLSSEPHLAGQPLTSLVGGRLRLTQGGCTPLTPAEPARSFRCKFRCALTFDAAIAHHACAPTAHTLHRHLAHEDRKPAVHAWHYVRRLHQPTSFRCGPVGRRGRRSRPASQGTNTEAHCQERSERSERRTKCLLTVSVFVQAGDRIVRKKVRAQRARLIVS